MFSFWNQELDLSKKPQVVLIGDGGTGKTSFFSRVTCPDKTEYRFNREYKATHGFDLKEVIVPTDHGEIGMHVWDTAGQ